jgi:hypothetical protein
VTGQKKQGGDAFASLRHQRRVKTAKKADELDGQERKPADMKNTVEKQAASATTLNTQTAQSDSEELFNPQEWEALLNSFENDAAAGSSTRATEPPVELSSDDLWERLSSTRWIRTPAADDTDSTVAIRPMD